VLNITTYKKRNSWLAVWDDNTTIQESAKTEAEAIGLLVIKIAMNTGYIGLLRLQG
jgi:hypothetical protein